MPKVVRLTGIGGSRIGMHDIMSSRVSTVGSHPSCDLVLKDQLILARHAEIWQALERWFVKPLDPKAAVFVNSQPIVTQGRLNDGDLVTFGSVTFQVAITTVAEQAVGQSAPRPRSNIPYLGEYLVQHGIVEEQHIAQALERQKHLQLQGRRIDLGEVLYELGYVSRHQLAQAIRAQQSDFFEQFRD